MILMVVTYVTYKETVLRMELHQIRFQIRYPISVNYCIDVVQVYLALYRLK